MKQLKEDYQNCKVIGVYIHSDLLLIKERLHLQGRTESQIEFRLSRISEVFSDYVINSGFFDEVLINSSNKKDFYTVIDNLINKYT